MNALEVIDEKGEVTRVALDAQIALEDGDTIRSALLFMQAGEMLESSVARLEKPSERDLARFLAATHYYKGGAYTKAAQICDKIRQNRLPSRVRHLYPPFLKDLRERSAPDYSGRHAAIIKDLYLRVTRDGDRNDAQSVIDLLIAHPYVVDRYLMAHMRARCCDVLGLRRATTLFYRDAWRFNPDRPYGLPPYLDSLCKEGKYAEAWKIVEGELADHPGVRSSTCAMLVINAVRIRDGLTDQAQPSGEPPSSLRELLDHFESAERAYRSLSPSERPSIALLIDFAFSTAWVAYFELGDAGGQLETLERWIELPPQRPDPYVIRGIITHPGAASVRDFQAAMQRGTTDPWPYYALAAEALRVGDFREVDRLCELALELHPDARIRATLLAWRAISLWNRRSRADGRIRELLAEASRLEPDDSWIANYAQAFSEGAAPPDLPSILESGASAISVERAQEYADESLRRVRDGMSQLFSGSAA